MILSEQIHIFSCFALFGLIWLIQLVHYPAYYYIDKSQFISYQKFHTHSITFLVGPLMIAEIATAIHLLITMPNLGFTVNLLSIGLIWLSTFFLSVPAHNQLGLGHSEKMIRKLILTNWIRTLIWSLRSLSWLWISTHKGLLQGIS